MELQEISKKIEVLKKNLENKNIPENLRKELPNKIKELEKLRSEIEGKDKEIKQAEKVISTSTVKVKKATTTKEKVVHEKDKKEATVHKAKATKDISEVKKSVSDILSKYSKVIKNFNSGRSTSNIIRDKGRTALPLGKRVSESGKAYYESRPNRSDINQKAKLERGGEVNKFDYMMLGRLQQDCEYYLGNGNRSEKNLWAKSVDAQIEEMKKIWNSLPIDKKPEWLTMEDILRYEKEMKSEYAKGGETHSEEDSFEKGDKVKKRTTGEKAEVLRRNHNGSKHHESYVVKKEDGKEGYWWASDMEVCYECGGRAYKHGGELDVYKLIDKQTGLAEFIGSYEECLTERKRLIKEFGGVTSIPEEYYTIKKQLEHGGELDNKEMVVNKANEIAHHVKELHETLESKEDVPAWVVAKIERSATDISDVAHYLDGEGKEFGKGGQLSDRFEVGTPAHFEENGEYRSGEIVMNKIAMFHPREGADRKLYIAGELKGIMLYPDKNYSGSAERFYVPDDWGKIKKFSELAKGGQTFASKTKAVASSLSGKDVPAKYQKTYGKKYSLKEAKEAANRIIGKQVSGEKKMVKGGKVGEIIERSGSNYKVKILETWDGFERGDKERPVIYAKTQRVKSDGSLVKTDKPRNEIIEFKY